MSARYNAAKAVTKSKTACMLEGKLLDTFTARALVAVYEALSPASKVKFDTMPLVGLAAFCVDRVKA